VDTPWRRYGNRAGERCTRRTVQLGSGVGVQIRRTVGLNKLELFDFEEIESDLCERFDRTSSTFFYHRFEGKFKSATRNCARTQHLLMLLLSVLPAFSSVSLDIGQPYCPILSFRNSRWFEFYSMFTTIIDRPLTLPTQKISYMPLRSCLRDSALETIIYVGIYMYVDMYMYVHLYMYVDMDM